MEFFVIEPQLKKCITQGNTYMSVAKPAALAF